MENFKVLKTLGTGAFGRVLKVKRIEDDQIYAIKKVNIRGLSSKERKNALNEVRILASLNHPQIIAYKDAFYEESTTSLCIVMEFAEGGDLQQLINKTKKSKEFVPEATVWKYVIQMVNGIKYLHDMKIVHRDLKCANVFLTKEGDIKLGDLNVSKVNHGGLMFTQTGTPYYASPEVWKDKPYDAKSDIWSLGCVLYELCALTPPFTASDMKGLYNKVIKGNFKRIPDMYTDDLANVINMCLKVQPTSRPTAANLLRKKEIVLHLRENGIDGDDVNKSLNLLDTIKLPSDLRLIKDRLPTPKYTLDVEEMKDLPTKKYRGYSARNREKHHSDLYQKAKNRDMSLLALKKYQRSPASSSQIRVKQTNRKASGMMLPPRSNRAAGYNKVASKPGLQLPPISKPAGVPSLGYRYNSNIRNRSQDRNASRVLPMGDYHSVNSNGSDRGYKRRLEKASRQKLQQQLINKAFGLPITPINRNL